MTVSVLLHQITGANPAEEAFIREATSLLRKAVQRPGFGASVRQADYGTAAWKNMQGTCTELTGDQIWDRIQGGREYGNTGDHALDLSIELANLPGPGPADGQLPVIGATELGTLPIRTARWFVNACMVANDPVNMAAHLMHQWMHVSGFVHGPDGRDSRDAPAVVAALVRRALEWDHGDRIDPELTSLLIGSDTSCSCSKAGHAQVAA
jgi:hypothetical protein